MLNGGHALVFVDPHSEFQAAHPSMLTPPGSPTAADFDPVLKAWGVELAKGKVVGDRDAARRVNAGGGAHVQAADYLAWLSLTGDDLNHEDPVTGKLSEINVATAGALLPIKDAKTKIEPLLQSSANSELIDADKIGQMPDVLGLLRDFKSTDTRYTIAARITGPADTGFPDGPPPAVDAQGKPVEKADPKADDAAKAVQLKTAKTPIDVIVVADSDLLDDRFWVSVQDFFGQRVATPQAGNADFVANAVDSLAGTGDLIGLRSRGSAVRPFTLIEDVQRRAQDKYQAQEKSLQDKLKETQAKLDEISKGKDDDSDKLSPDQVQARRPVSRHHHPDPPAAAPGAAGAARGDRPAEARAGRPRCRRRAARRGFCGADRRPCALASPQAARRLSDGGKSTMRQKTLIALAIVTVPVLAAAIFVPSRHGTVLKHADTGPVFPTLKDWLAGATKLTVTAADGKAVTLSRTAPAAPAAGETLPLTGWGLADKSGYPVQDSVLRPVLAGLLALHTTEPKTERPKLYDRVDVEDPSSLKDAKSKLLELDNGNGANIVKLIIGRRKYDAFRRRRRDLYRKPEEERAWLAQPAFDVPGRRYGLDRPQDRRYRPGQDQIGHPGCRRRQAVVLDRAKAEDKLAIRDLAKDATTRSETPGNDVAAGFRYLDMLDVRPVAQITGAAAATVDVVTFDGLDATFSLYDQRRAGRGSKWRPKARALRPRTRTRSSRRTRGWAYKLAPQRAKLLETKLADLLTPVPPKPAEAPKPEEPAKPGRAQSKPVK
ncbi:MAG: hypothetical protein WDN69_27210 [Aliidongia sp.]